MRLLFVSLAFSVLGVGLAQSSAPEEIPTVPGQNEDLRASYCGKVVALSKEGVTVKPQGFVKTVAYEPIGNGLFNNREYRQDNTQPPRTFLFTDELLHHSGLNPNYRGPSCAYFGHKVTDLRMGDVIRLSCPPPGEKEFCTGFVIERRPGGKVPPTMFDETLIKLDKEQGTNSDRHRHDVGVNAAQAREEKATAALAKVALRFLH